MSFTIEQLQAFSNRKPEIRQITEEIIDYLQTNPGGASGGTLQDVTDGGNITDNDVEITGIDKGLILKSADGTRWRITINDAGALISTEIETLII